MKGGKFFAPHPANMDKDSHENGKARQLSADFVDISIWEEIYLFDFAKVSCGMG